jgi:PAS domain S-box-containing protein
VETGSLRILHQALLGEALMSGDSALFVTDDEGRYLAANDSALALLGYTREELASINARDVSTRTDDEIDEVFAMLKRDHSVQRTARFRRKDGVVGTIAYVGVESKVGGLPVVVAITAPIGTFVPER